MALSSITYEPRDPTSTLLYGIVRDHFETFRAHAAALREGEGLPRFVEQDFRDFLRCGCLAGGFARFRCAACGLDRLVAFSCKGRGFCPRCGGRRMAERSAHLVDHVFPDVPVPQWVLSLPHRCGTCWRGITTCAARSAASPYARCSASSGAARAVTASPTVAAGPWSSCGASVGR
ncbi:MAG: transposase zinc-binding domain-containing protein [Acidobacteria bacterium]|nr:transposase zinc-binding domain-containing protein [Acidobacteriota bacterium]